MKFLLGTKGKMTQVFNEDGTVMPGTVVKTGALTVTQVKSADSDGYASVQVGFGEKKERNLSKSQKGHLKDLGNLRHIREFRGEMDTKRGEKIEVDSFEEGDIVTVSAISKGKGFQGVVKRHNFAGGPRTHGQKHSERAPGSIGAQGPQRVLKGKRMAGRMGGDRVTVKNLKVLQIDKEAGVIVISGAIPGRPGTLVEVRG